MKKKAKGGALGFLYFLFLVASIGFSLGGCLSKDQGAEILEKFNTAIAAQSYSQINSLAREYIASPESKKEKALEVAEQTAKILFLNLKSYNNALFFYKYLVVHSKDEDKKRESQEKIAEIQYSYLMNYSQALVELHKLLETLKMPQEIKMTRIKIAKSYFYLNNFYQANSEINDLLKMENTLEEEYELLLLKGSVFLSEKKIKEAINLYDEMIKKFPNKSIKDNLSLNLAICYEENKEFNKAIQVLQEAKRHYKVPEFLDVRIRRLEKRISQLPGAKGFRK